MCNAINSSLAMDWNRLNFDDQRNSTCKKKGCWRERPFFWIYSSQVFWKRQRRTKRHVEKTKREMHTNFHSLVNEWLQILLRSIWHVNFSDIIGVFQANRKWSHLFHSLDACSSTFFLPDYADEMTRIIISISVEFANWPH